MSVSVPFIDAIERRYELTNGTRWMSKYWYASLVAASLYLSLVWAGKRWMRDRPKYTLQRPLTMWNTALALFSFIGFVRVAPHYFSALAKGGFSLAVCWSDVYTSAQPSLWGFLFCISKMLELFDTAFVLLRRSQLTFLHCYHHTTVLIYAWNEYPSTDAIGITFCTWNYFVHMLMYSYYAVKASGRGVPVWIAQGITALQLGQFLLAFYSNSLAYWLKESGQECQLHDSTFYMGVAIYGSYTVLFVNFFYQRYCKPRPKRAA